MDKNENIYNGATALGACTRKHLDPKVGVIVAPVHPNHGLGNFACDIYVQRPALITDSFGGAKELHELNEDVAGSLKRVIEVMDSQVEDLLKHRDLLKLELEKITSGELDLNTRAIAQRDEYWSDHPLNKDMRRV